jgi:hypothetical protein
MPKRLPKPENEVAPELDEEEEPDEGGLYEPLEPLPHE